MAPTTAARRALNARAALVALLAAVGVTVVLRELPLVGYPLRYLSTYFHEMGHGIAGLLVGGRFEGFELRLDGGGMAYIRDYDTTSWRRAVVAAGGFFGAAFGSAGLFALARGVRGSRVALAALGVASGITALLWTKGLLAFGVAAALGAVCLVAAARGRPLLVRCLVLFLALEVALSVYRASGYLFSAKTSWGAESDTLHLAQSLGGHYALWGALVFVVTLAIVVGGVYAFYRSLAPVAPASSASPSRP